MQRAIDAKKVTTHPPPYRLINTPDQPTCNTSIVIHNAIITPHHCTLVTYHGHSLCSIHPIISSIHPIKAEDEALAALEAERKDMWRPTDVDDMEVRQHTLTTNTPLQYTPTTNTSQQPTHTNNQHIPSIHTNNQHTRSIPTVNLLHQNSPSTLP